MIGLIVCFLLGVVGTLGVLLFAISDAGRARIIGLQLLEAADARLDAEADAQ